MISRYSFNDIWMFFQKPQVSFFVGEEHKLFGSRLCIGEKQFGQQPAEFSPVGILFIQTVEVLIGNKNHLRVFHGFYIIPAGILRNKTSEGNNKLVLRKKEKVLFG